MKETSDPAAVRFGPFLYEPFNGRLLRAGAELGVPPRALAILGCLVAQPGLLVTKQRLLDQVWKDAFVTDTSLSEAVSVLRQALGDDAQDPSYVQTVPRRGYRFVAPVEPATPVLPASVAATATPGIGHVGAEPLWTPWLPWLGCFAAGLAFGVLAIALPRQSSVDRAPVTRFTLPLPAGQQLAGSQSLAVSADGSLIVAVLEDQVGRRGAWVRSLEGSTFQYLPGSEDARLPLVSADGTRVGVVVGDRIRAMAMPSGLWSTVATASLVRGAAWMADGSLVVASGADGALRRVFPRGGDPITIARPRYDLGEAALTTPTQAGAAELVFAATRPGRDPMLYAWPAAASSPRMLTAGSAPQWIAPSHLLMRNGDRVHVAGIASPTWTVTRTAMLATQGLLSAGDVFAASASTFVRTSPCRDCAEVRITGHDGTIAAVAIPGSGVESWRLAADGASVVAIARHGEDRQVWRIGVDDGSSVLLDRGHAYAIATDTSGRHTVAASQQDGRWEIRELTPERSSRASIVDTVPLEPSAVTDAGQVWFHKVGVNASLDVWTASPDGRVHAAIATAADEWNAQPSPDGRYLAWLSDARGESEVVVRDLQSGATLGAIPASRMRWAARGTTLLIGSDRHWQALPLVEGLETLPAPSAVPVDARLPAAPSPVTELDVVLQWAREVRRQIPMTPRPLPVVR